VTSNNFLIPLILNTYLYNFVWNRVVADFRAQVKIWRGWDVTMSLANFRVVLSTVVKLWKELQVRVLFPILDLEVMKSAR
jgi:hypothetical protein